jgi:tRNA-dihydrouridine synthase
MISDCGLIYDNKETKELLLTDGNEGLLAVQLFGGSKETLVKGIKILESMDIKYDILDLNLACPVYKVTKNNGGSSWLKDLNLLEEMIKECGNPYYMVGDCNKVSNIKDAIFTAYEVTRKL